MHAKGRVQITTDALRTYVNVIEDAFGSEVDYAQVVKTYSVTPLGKAASVRYSPAEVVKAEKNVMMGRPDVSLICTSHIEKQNHTLRMHCRRLTRLTNAFSKKLENHGAAVALYVRWFNLCRVHETLRIKIYTD